MNKELQEKLYAKYPKIFADKDKSMQETCMYWGIETGDGWYWLIDQLCGSIQSYIDSNSKRTRIKNKYIRRFRDIILNLRVKGKYNWITKKFSYKFFDRFEIETYEAIPQVVASQVKEKYGSLRFYYNGGDSMIHGIVWLAEDMSYDICEVCGSTKNVTQTKGWITSLCEDCMKKREEKLAKST